MPRRNALSGSFARASLALWWRSTAAANRSSARALASAASLWRRDNVCASAGTSTPLSNSRWRSDSAAALAASRAASANEFSTDSASLIRSPSFSRPETRFPAARTASAVAPARSPSSLLSRAAAS